MTSGVTVSPDHRRRTQHWLNGQLTVMPVGHWEDRGACYSVAKHLRTDTSITWKANQLPLNLWFKGEKVRKMLKVWLIFTRCR